MKYFSEMGLKPELTEAIKRMGFIKPTEVQEQVIPVALRKEDVIVKARTGTGKTCAFLIPIIQNSVSSPTPIALVIVPTRELALQISEVASKLVSNSKRVAVVYGASSIGAQIQNLRRNPSIVVGTPGRTLDLVERGALVLNNIKFMVIDEADTMLDMGFIDDIKTILSKTPSSRQTLLFSATIPESILSVARNYMHDHTYMKIGEEEGIIATKITHYYSVCESRMKLATLIAYIKTQNPKKAIIFTQTQHAANEVNRGLKSQGIDSLLMHGGLTQARREASIREFKRQGQLLIATNVAARGIDVKAVSDIINFDIPEDPRIYVHRVGRSARMEADGKAFTIVENYNSDLLHQIERMTNIEMNKLVLDTTPYKDVQIFKGRGGGDFRRREGGRKEGGRRFGGRRPREGSFHGRGGFGHSQRRSPFYRKRFSGS